MCLGKGERHSRELKLRNVPSGQVQFGGRVLVLRLCSRLHFDHPRLGIMHGLFCGNLYVGRGSGAACCAQLESIKAAQDNPRA